MKLYKCKVRLGGSVMNEVRKDSVTAAEVEILRAFHGSDAVIEIVETGEDKKRTSAAERERLYGLYANQSDNMAEAYEKKMRKIRDLFGHDRLPLPDALDDVVEAAEMEPAPAPRGKKASEQPAFAE